MEWERTFSFGYWLRRRRKALDLTQEALADQVGCTSSMIKRIEADERRPSRQLAERLANTLALAPEERAAFIQAARAVLAPDRLAIAAQPLDAPTRRSACRCAGARRAVADRHGHISVHRYRRQHAAVGAAPAGDAGRAARHDAILRQVDCGSAAA